MSNNELGRRGVVPTKAKLNYPDHDSLPEIPPQPLLGVCSRLLP